MGVFAVALGLQGCSAPLPPASFAATAPSIDPMAFFAGQTHSWGLRETPGGAPAAHLEVRGQGTIEPDGGLRLVQTIHLGAKTTVRTWRFHRIDAHHYLGSLTDAAGPVQGEVWGGLLHIRYAMKGPPGLRMEQWLYLQANGKELVNEATVSILGLQVARISELITHEASPAS